MNKEEKSDILISNWKEKVIKDISKINPSKDELKNIDENLEVSFIPMANVSEEGKIIHLDKRLLKQVKKGFTYFRDNDILLAKITPCFENGKRAIANNLSNGIGFGTTEFYVFRANNEVIPKWIYYTFSREDFRALAKRSMTGAVGQQRVSKSFIENFKINYPESLDEQKVIVSEIEKQITRIDEANISLEALKKKLEIYRRAVLVKSFYGKLKTLPEIISKDKHSIKRGPFGGSLKKEIFVPKGYKVYEQQHAINKDFNIGRYFITKEKFEEMKSFIVKPGDFIISCSGTIGRIAEVPKEITEGIINQALLKITLDNSKILNKYFQYLFESEIIQRHLTVISRGVAIKNVPSVKELKEIKFPVPDDISEQQEIVQYIEDKFSVIEKLEEVVDQALKKTEKLKKSILKSAFDGKLVKRK